MPQTTICIRPNHVVTLEPVVPGVRENLLRHEIRFEAGGPLGHQFQPEESDQFTEIVRQRLWNDRENRAERKELQRLPIGLIPKVSDYLKEHGHPVEVTDLRQDSSQWVPAENWRAKTPANLRGFIAAAGKHRTLRVIAANIELIAATIVGVARAYPKERIAVAMPTHQHLWKLRQKIRWRLPEEPLGLYTSKCKQSARVSIGLIRQLPRGSNDEFDLLILPVAERTIGDNDLEIILSGRFRRILSFTPARQSRDHEVNCRLQMIAESVFPPEKPKSTVAVVMLDTHGTKPPGKFQDPLDAKRRLYWHNDRRNRRVAEVARRLVLRRTKTVLSLIGDAMLSQEILTATKTGVAVLVETPEHARELAKWLPGWAVWKGGDLEVAKPEPGCGVIVTEMAARETVISAGVLIRATGMKWPMPDIDWPWLDDVEHGVLVDFTDDYHPIAVGNSKERSDIYARAGMRVWEPKTQDASGHSPKTQGVHGRETD